MLLSKINNNFNYDIVRLDKIINLNENCQTIEYKDKIHSKYFLPIKYNDKNKSILRIIYFDQPDINKEL